MKRFTEARQVIEELRRTYNDGRSGRVTVWIMIAEGITQIYEDLSPDALDRIKRAQLLGIAMDYPTMIALASAWKAHVEFEVGDYPAMLHSLELAIKNCDESNLDAMTRLAVIMCDAFMICGNRAHAQKWFMRARESAAKNGDQLSLEALLYNRAAFLTTRARAENCIQEVSADDLRSIRMEIESARNFQRLTKLEVLPSHLELWDARLQILEGEYLSAIGKLQAARGRSFFAEHNFSRAYIDLEVAYCQFRLGEIDVAAHSFLAIESLNLGKLDVDEQMVGSWMLFSMAKVDERFGPMTELQAEFQGKRRIYEDTMQSLADGLGRFLDVP
jgi:ATP/maltotriose-dependent transcriptional regulator MalT